MFLKSGLKAATAGNSIYSPVQLQEFLDDVTFRDIASLGSCLAAPPHGAGWTHVG